MKKRIVIIMTFIGIFSILLGIFFNNVDKKIEALYINKVLETEAYAYLPSEAKDFVKSVYEDTGELVLTEKNKEENNPYLNPDYINYLTLTEKEQEEVEATPELYVVDYTLNEGFENAELPETFDFRNVNGNNYLTPMKNQESTGLCWSFASIENIETLLMYKNNTPYNENSQIFSVRQMDYATSYDGLYDKIINGEKQAYSNPLNGYRNIQRGGTYITSSSIMANGLSLVDESVLPWSETTELMHTKDILNYNNSLYELNRGIQLPVLNYSSLSDDAKEEYVNSYVNKVKTYMIEYGAPIIGTLSPQRTQYQYCSFKNSDGNYVVRVDDCRDKSTGSHAVQIIGWDDNYTYEYCKGDKENLDATNGTCSEGEYKTGKGAWIIRNSWGTMKGDTPHPYQYFYIAYDSQYGTIAFSADISSMINRAWDNNYHTNLWKYDEAKSSWNYSHINSQTKEFDTHNDKKEKIEKIKILTSTVDGSYNLTINNGSNTYNYSSGLVNEQGIFTFELANENILVDKNFSVTVTGNDNNKIIKDSIYVFTSNVDDDYKLKAYSENANDPEKPVSKNNPIYLDSATNNNFSLTTYLKNINANADITYRFRDRNNNIVNIATVNSYYYNDYEEVVFTNINSNTLGNTYLLEAVYNNEVIDTYFVKFYNANNETKSNIYLHTVNSYYETVEVTDKKDSIISLDSINTANSYNNGYYITGWNTKADGSGTSYDLDDKINVYTDTDLYAVWSNDVLKVNISYKCLDSNCTGNVSSVNNLSYNQQFTTAKNSFVREGYTFTGWKYGNKLIEAEKEILPSTIAPNLVLNNYDIVLNPVWEKNKYKVKFNANDGTNNYTEQEVVHGTATVLNQNIFTREGYDFEGWNTKADGSGDSYSDLEEVTLTNNLELYAIWKIKSFTITFKTNGGSSVSSQKIDYGKKVTVPTDPNRIGYSFAGWYSEEELTNLYDFNTLVTSDVFLYAKWEKNKYKIKFKANDGTDNYTEQEVLHDTRVALNQNTFTREGYTFSGWNTKADGSGSSYSDLEEVSLSGNLDLYAIWREKYDFVINKYGVDDTNNYLNKIGVGTTVEDFKKNIELNSEYSVKVDTKTVNSKPVLYTGGKTTIYKNNKVYVEYTNVVTGDIDGDGVTNSKELLRVRQHLLGRVTLTGIEFLAVDINYDSKINSGDLLRIRQHLLGVKPIE